MQRVQVLYQLSEEIKFVQGSTKQSTFKRGTFRIAYTLYDRSPREPHDANATTSNTSVIRGEYINNTGSSLRQRNTEYKTNVPADGRSINWYTLSLLNT